MPISDIYQLTTILMSLELNQPTRQASPLHSAGCTIEALLDDVFQVVTLPALWQQNAFHGRFPCGIEALMRRAANHS
jgi:hypothetical protein